ncbi:hypothetical protein C2E21_8881 [Chlorella sorokiniana]|uniref:Uncharacterized protein n=1 Tax=Chlorella sorokiniana TaxID=3076 RepID=A0A2P6TDC5_CHLSO|nr:hypothetical protein C2E21_8881 [Chlorella sorokiniana]|eukprot:PRW20635.1 hypothetical protein C2E21_8881 [Chlorella sorokiniana]
MSLHKLLEHTPARVQGLLPQRLLDAAEGGGGGGAVVRAAGLEEEAQAVGLGGGYTLNVASAEAAPEEPTPQAEPAVEREAEVAALAAKGGQFVQKAEPARAPAFAPWSPGEERPGLAAAPPTVEPLPAAGALGAEPRSPVAKIDAHMRAVQEFRAKTAEILKAEEALPGGEETAGVGAAAPAASSLATGVLLGGEPRITRRSPVPLERMPSDLTGQEGRPQAPGLEVLHEGPEGTSAEGSAHAGVKRSASIPLEAAAAGAGAALVPEKFEALAGPYGRGISAPTLYPGEEPALPPEAIAAVDLGESEEEGEEPPPLATPSPTAELELAEDEAAARAIGEQPSPAAGIFATPAGLERQPPPAGEEKAAGGEAAAPDEGSIETAEARLKGLFAPVGMAAGVVGGFVGAGLARAGAAAGGAGGAVAEAIHIPGISRAGPAEPAVGAEAGAAEAGAAEAAPELAMQPPLAPAEAAAVEAETAAGPGAAEAKAPVPAAEGLRAMPELAAPEAEAAVPPEWLPGSEALLAGRSGERVGVQRVDLPALGRSVPLESRIVAEEKVAGELAAAQKQRIIEGGPAVAGMGAAAAAAPSAAIPVPAMPSQAAPPAMEAQAPEGLAAEREAPPAAAAELAAAEEAAVESRPEAAAGVAGEQLGAAAVEEEETKEQAPAAAEAARPSPFEAKEAVAAPAATAEPTVEAAAAAVPAAPVQEEAAEKPVAVAAEKPAVAAPPTPAKEVPAAASKPEILPSPPAPAAAASTRTGAAVPKKKKRNPIHKIQKMLGMKPYSTPRS